MSGGDLIKDMVAFYTREAGSTNVAPDLDKVRSRIERSRGDAELVLSRLSVALDTVSGLQSPFEVEMRIAIRRAFGTFLNHKLCDTFLGFTHDHSEHRKVVGWIAEHFESGQRSPYFVNQLHFYEGLQGEAVEKKLAVEYYYYEVIRLLNGRADRETLELILTGLHLATELQDENRRLYFLTCLQYLTYNQYGLSRTANQMGQAIIDAAGVLGDSLRLAIVHYYIGNSQVDLGNYELADIEYNNALNIYARLGHRSGMSTMYERLGVVRRHLGDFDEAMTCYDNMRKVSVQARPEITNINYNLGVGLVYKDQGEFTTAEAHYKTALSLANEAESRRKQSDFSSDKVITLNNMGELYVMMGDYDKALANFREAEKIASQSHSIPPFSKVNYLLGMTDTYILMDSLEAAKQSSNDCLQLLNQFDFGLPKAQKLASAGKFAMLTHNLTFALSAFDSCLAFYERTGELGGQIEQLINKARVLREMQLYDQTLATLERADGLSRRLRKDKNRWALKFEFAEYHRAKKDFEKAKDYLHDAVAEIERITGDLTYEVQPYFTQHIQDVYETLALLYLQDRDENGTQMAFQYANKSKAQVMNILFGNVAPDELGVCKTGAENMALAEVDIESLQKNLREDTAVLQFEMTAEHLLSWFISNERFEALPPAAVSRDSLDKMVGAFRKRMTPDSTWDWKVIKDTYPGTAKLSREFYDIFIAPLLPRLEGKKVLMLVLDESLNYLPFAAFMAPDATYLVRSFALATSPSAAILQKTLAPTEQMRDTSTTILKIAPAKLPPVQQTSNGLVRMDMLQDSNATEEALRQALDDNLYRAVIFATHGFIDERNPALSTLKLNKGAESDGFLRMAEVPGLSLCRTDLAFLSTCESALGRLFRGEGMISMKRAFLIAGANSVVANLWQVGDGSAEELTNRFLSNWLQAKQSKIKALQKTQLEMIEVAKSDFGYPHPFFWAPAVLTGALN